MTPFAAQISKERPCRGQLARRRRARLPLLVQAGQETRGSPRDRGGPAAASDPFHAGTRRRRERETATGRSRTRAPCARDALRFRRRNCEERLELIGHRGLEPRSARPSADARRPSRRDLRAGRSGTAADRPGVAVARSRPARSSSARFDNASLRSIFPRGGRVERRHDAERDVGRLVVPRIGVRHVIRERADRRRPRRGGRPARLAPAPPRSARRAAPTPPIRRSLRRRTSARRRTASAASGPATSRAARPGPFT